MREPEFFDRLDRLLDEALTLDRPDRGELLRELTRTDPDLAGELGALLRYDERQDRFLERRQAQASRDRLLARALAERKQTEAPVDFPEARFGAYRVEREIARGLHSVVYRGRREDEDWTQEVAIKVLTRGFDADDVMRRFLAERQILSVLRHPRIATLLDGGIASDGAPYFVMEYIDGIPITDYCRERRLSLLERVRLCRDVCSAVAYAHRHLVVHRDIKPSNILVTGDGRVKLLDFGIAKLLAGCEAAVLDPARAAQTVDVVRPMTPRYASPEQLGDGAISSATDVYQLGLLFTEMLAGVDDAREALTASAEQGPSVMPSRTGGTGSETLPYARRDLSGDLDWILLKALETSPDARYASAAELAQDIDSYLESRPVRARRATAPYVLRKFVQRRPLLSGALAVLLIGALGFIGVLSHFNRQLETERAAAVEAATLAAEVKDVLVGFIRSPDPYEGDGADTRISDVLVRSEQRVENDLDDRPQLQAELYGALGDVYQGLAMHERAVAMRDRELRLRTTLNEAERLALWQLRRKRAESLMALGDTGAAIETLEKLQGVLTENAPDAWAERAKVEMQIGSYHVIYGQATDGLPHLEAAVAMAEKPTVDRSLEADTLHALAVGLDYLGRYEEAWRLLSRADELRIAALGPEHIQTLLGRARMAANLSNQTRYDESIAMYKDLIPVMEQRLGPLHEEVMVVMNNLAYSHDLAGNLPEAAAIHLEVLDRRREKFGNVHRAVADSLQNVGSVLKRIDRHEEAIAALNEAAEIYLQVNEPGQQRNAYPHVSLAIIYADIGPLDRQEYHARRAISLLEGSANRAHPALLRSQCLLGDALARQGSAERGVALLQAGVRGLEAQSDLYVTHLEACRRALASANDRLAARG